MQTHLGSALAALAMLATHAACAAVSADEAKQLGVGLTFWGAEKGANKDGTIPAYSNEKLVAPAAWDRKTQGYPDTWNEKPLFSITAQNVDKYSDKLDGMVEMFKKYPNYRMDVYPSHRTANFPKYFLENTVRNATACKGIEEDQKIDGCYPGFPFPIPKSGRQVMWNKLLSFGGNYALQTDNLATWVTPTNGNPVLQSDNLLYEQFPPHGAERRDKPMQQQDSFFLARIDSVNPPRAAGQKYIFELKINLNDGSRAWSYIPGQRRVKLAPDLRYDTPSPLSGGSQLMDEGQGFYGAMDRFDFKLGGKKEKYILYNGAMLTDPRVCPDSKVVSSKNFAHPDCIRWELHRVWVVNATLKPQFRHAYKRRSFFWDEDTFVGGAEGYDAADKLYRITNVVHYPLFEGGYVATSSMANDLQTGIWDFQGAYGKPGAAFYPTNPKPDTFFTPEALAGEGIR